MLLSFKNNRNGVHAVGQKCKEDGASLELAGSSQTVNIQYVIRYTNTWEDAAQYGCQKNISQNRLKKMFPTQERSIKLADACSS